MTKIATKACIRRGVLYLLLTGYCLVCGYASGISITQEYMPRNNIGGLLSSPSSVLESNKLDPPLPATAKLTLAKLHKWSKPPHDWDEYTFYDIRKHFDCRAHAHDQSKELYTLENWNYLRKQYRETVDATVEFDDPVLPTEGYTLGEEGGPVPYYAKRSEGKGRGLFGKLQTYANIY